MAQLLAAYLASLILRSIGIALVAGICSWKIRNVAVRHAVWVVVLGAMLLMPAVDYLLPASWVPARVPRIAAKQPVAFRIPSARAAGVPQTHAPAAAAVTMPNRSSSVNLWNVAATLYALVAFAMFTRLALGYRKVRKLRGSARAITSTVCEEIVGSHRTRWRMPVLLESELVQVPMTIGFIRPAVILPVGWENWDDWKLRAVLLHELAHVRRVDWGIAVVATAAKCAYWLNPVSWVLERQLLQLAEQSSDDATLSNIQNPTYYAEILLEFAVAAQNGGRLMKRGVAMAQSNMKARIERVLGNPKTGTGIVNVAGWILVMMSAAPVIYSSAALQVKSETVKSALPTYAAELGRNPMSQTLPAGPQAAPTPAPATAPQSRQNLSNPAAHLSGPFQMELENRKLQREYEALKQKLAEAQLVANQASTGPAPELQDTARIGGSVAFLQDELKKTDEQLRTLQAAMLQQSQVNPPTAPASALLDLPDNEDDLLGYLKALASLRANPNAGSYMVSFTGIQGRIISMKVSGPTFSFGCESCSFFVGESVVSSAASARPGPGLLVRLSSDGNELAITCRATNCWSGDQGDNTRPGGMRRMVFGDSEIFPVSKLPNVVISKD